MIPTLGASGFLPPGRFPASVAEVESTYVKAEQFSGSSTRAQIWSDWQQATADLRAAVPVCAAWLAGSFLSDKADPDDLDVLYIVPAREAFSKKTADPAVVNILGAFALNHVRDLTGLRLDTFVLEWVRTSKPGISPINEAYFRERGHWDDFWQRRRHGPKGAPAMDEDCLPERGFLEVTLDGWTI